MLSQVSCGQQDSRVLGRSRGGRTGVWPGPSRGLPGAQGPGCGKERREEPGPGRARGRPSHRRARSLLPVSTRGGSGGGRPGPEPAASLAAGCGTDMHAGAGSTRAAARPPGRAKGGEPCSPVSLPDPSRRALPLGPVTPHARQGREVSTRACLSPRGRPGRQLSRPTTDTALRVRPHPVGTATATVLEPSLPFPPAAGAPPRAWAPLSTRHGILPGSPSHCVWNKPRTVPCFLRDAELASGIHILVPN